jgi:hypothetical protein
VCPSPRAKAVLICMAAYADADGCAWAAVSTLLIETSLGHERTVKRGLADLRAVGLLEDTGEHKVVFGKLIPIYRFPMERGPANTRQRLEQERERCASAVTPVSPQDGCGDADVMPRGDTAAELGVTPVSPKLEQNFEDNSKRGREASFADLRKVEEAYPKKGLGFTDRDAALVALQAVFDEGVTLDELIGAALGYRNDPILKKRDFGPVGLHRWLASGRYRGWMPDAQLPLVQPAEAGKAAAHPAAAPAADQATWAKVEARLGSALTEVEFSYIRHAFLGERSGLLFVVANSGIARDRIRDRSWRRVAAWWSETDPAKRPLTLISKAEFEAGAARETPGVA